MKPSERLPIEEYKDIIKETVAKHDVTVITAETGAGKSTQVPQYLMEAGHNVVVTQPRRLAARTVADRVSEELSYRLKQADQTSRTRGQIRDLVGYRTAFERKDSPDNKILFCTDGLQMVRELLGNQKTDVLVIDEVHEWNINIETLVAWTRKQINEGQKMKLVLMSATMEAEKLAQYYGEGTPVISVPGRLFPVSEKQVAGHQTISTIKEMVAKGRNVLVFMPGKKEIAQTIEELNRAGVDAEILPLHGDLTPEEQQRCFKSYGKPKVVVSTNVAQTSVTIPDIDAVVDSGEERRVELSDGIEGLYLKPVSNADRKQRKGRAGRCKEGEYVLASDIGAEQRPDFPKAEIERSRLDQLVLRLAAIGFDATELEFFHQPEKKVLEEAKRTLHALGAMTEDGKVTKIGRLMSKLPLSVQYSRMLIEAQEHNVTDDVLTAVSILEVGGLRAKGNEWQAHTQEKESDILAELDLWKAAQGKKNGELREMGIFGKSYYRAKELRRKLEGELRKNKLKQGSTGDRQAILKACVAGMVDHLYQSSGYGDYRNGDNGIRKLGRESVVQGSPEWLVGIPKDIQFRNRHNILCTMNLVSMATKVDPKWLVEVAPQLVKKRQERFFWNDETGEVTADEVTVFNGNDVGRTSVTASASQGAYNAFGQAMVRMTEKLPPAVAAALEDNKILMALSEDLHIRSGGEATAISSTDLQAHYSNLLAEQGILSLSALIKAVTEGRLTPDCLEIPLENFISEADQTRIEKQNPHKIELHGLPFQIQYFKTSDYYYGPKFLAAVAIALEQLEAMEGDSEPVKLASGRLLTLKLADAGYDNISANGLTEMKEKAEARRLEIAWTAFCKENNGENFKMEPLVELPAIPAPMVYDDKTDRMAYAGLQTDYYGNFSIRWFKTEDEAKTAQEYTEEKKKVIDRKAEETANFDRYVSEAEALKLELDSLIVTIGTDNNCTAYGFESVDSYNFRRVAQDPLCDAARIISREPLRAKEEILAIKKELEDRFARVVQVKAEAARLAQAEAAGELLREVEITCDTRYGRGRAWVIRPDGTLREHDGYGDAGRRYTAYIWKMIREELVIASGVTSVRGADNFRDNTGVIWKPKELTQAQIKAVEKIEAENNLGGTFEVSPELVAKRARMMEEISRQINRFMPSVQVNNLCFLDVASGSGYKLYFADDYNPAKMVNWNSPFTANCEGREAQIVKTIHCADGLLEFLVYDKWGTTNMNARWRELTEEEKQFGNVAQLEIEPQGAGLSTMAAALAGIRLDKTDETERKSAQSRKTAEPNPARTPEMVQGAEKMTEELRAELKKVLDLAAVFLGDVKGSPMPDNHRKKNRQAQERLNELKRLQAELDGSDNAASMRGKVNSLVAGAHKLTSNAAHILGHNEQWTDVYSEMLSTHIPAIEADYEGRLSAEGLAAIRSRLIEIAKRNGLDDVKDAIEELVADKLTA
ncbi:MAG: helicase-related protein [Patescibacteria group bacterium]